MTRYGRNIFQDLANLSNQSVQGLSVDRLTERYAGAVEDREGTAPHPGANRVQGKDVGVRRGGGGSGPFIRLVLGQRPGRRAGQGENEKKEDDEAGNGRAHGPSPTTGVAGF